MTDTLTIEMTDGRWVNGEPCAPGSRVKVRAAEAHEIVGNGWAKFLRDEDADAARAAFVAEQRALIRALNVGSPINGGSPWQSWRPH